ncbi:MAG: heavy-metal-associated domain-containing protein [Gammaproteobacteria bacterium]|uniref:Heavy-metal-associated domain-containing protein n=1 Tax=Candidatus Thiopontia autotrophica TaxID=2841688 RepID=A0A8J6TVZ1_9GAMM|nr:heavy-metal-associated domain-containing protein [Candidatus Thiopontia autotrophica]MBL6969068.1 heavy-metal-associated domain-containing protein [Gammaproteobacteria bacterium]
MFLMSGWATSLFAAGVQYEMRVDGLACPFCAYGIEKNFMKTEGVERVDIDLKRGLVIVDTQEGVRFTEDQLKQIFDDSGFSYRGVVERAR